MNIAQEYPDYWTAGQMIRKRKYWTKATIPKFLGKPDITIKHWEPGHDDIKLYLQARVIKEETRGEFKAWSDHQEQSEHAGLQKARKKKLIKSVPTEKIIEYAGFNKKYKGLSYDVLVAKAIHHYLKRNKITVNDENRGEFIQDCLKTGTRFLDRIVVNMLRHRATYYDCVFSRCDSGRVDRELLDRARAQAYSLIAEEYPFLEHECVRQIGQREHSTA